MGIALLYYYKWRCPVQPLLIKLYKLNAVHTIDSSWMTSDNSKASDLLNFDASINAACISK
jgi:hypothetical protein